MSMVVLGADTHKRSHTVVAADEAGVEAWFDHRWQQRRRAISNW